VVDGGSGEEMFTGMLDQHIAAETPAQWQHGLGDALFRQLRRSLPSSAPTATAGTSVDATSQQHPMHEQMQSLQQIQQIQQLQQLPQAAGSNMPAMTPASPERVGASGR
jgi:Rod binding domain-containing protein